jgi:hypothetical protein
MTELIVDDGLGFFRGVVVGLSIVALPWIALIAAVVR